MRVKFEMEDGKGRIEGYLEEGAGTVIYYSDHGNLPTAVWGEAFAKQHKDSNDPMIATAIRFINAIEEGARQ